MPDNSIECHMGQLMERSKMMEAQLVDLARKMDQMQTQLDQISMMRWRLDGGATVATWVGSAMLFVLGALGSIAVTWLFSTKGPLH